MQTNPKTYITEDDRNLLCDRFLYGGAKGGASIVEKMLSEGMPPRDLCLKVLGPVALKLGDLWKEDCVEFLSVSVASMRIEAILDPKIHGEPRTTENTRKRAIFASLPGDGHTIGLKMAAYLQRLKGWHIQLILRANYSDLLSEIERSSIEILGLSIGSSSSMHELFTFVKSLRRHRPSLKILVSGSLVATAEHPLHLLGVDAYAATFEEAENMLDELAEQT